MLPTLSTSTRATFLPAFSTALTAAVRSRCLKFIGPLGINRLLTFADEIKRRRLAFEAALLRQHLAHGAMAGQRQAVLPWSRPGRAEPPEPQQLRHGRRPDRPSASSGR